MNIEIHLPDIMPSNGVILQSIYNSHTAIPESHINKMVEEIKVRFENIVNPQGIISPVSRNTFTEIFFGEGLNSYPLPLEPILRQSFSLEVFVATLGPEISNHITEFFNQNDYLAGYILNAIASIATNNIASYFEKSHSKTGFKTLSYCPGYCGWHVSGQHALFRYLNPEGIGVSVNDEGLMNPIKSISGVLVTGEADIHRFKPCFSFCKKCADHTCIQRMKS